MLCEMHLQNSSVLLIQINEFEKEQRTAKHLYTQIRKMHGCVLLVPILKTVDMADSEFAFD